MSACDARSSRYGQVLDQPPHRPRGAGAARLGRGPGGIPPRARLDGAGAQRPDWRGENLPRIRDLVDQQLAALRNTCRAPKRPGSTNPPTPGACNTNPPGSRAASFLTRTHNALRLRWQLLDPAPGDGEALAASSRGSPKAAARWNARA